MSGVEQHRERDIVHAFVELSNDLVDDYDVVEMLTHLTRSCAELLDVAAAGLLIADEHGALHLAATSSERTHHLEVFQLQRDQGPCLDCYRSGEAVIAEDTNEIQRRWPGFAQAAKMVGYQSVHALPMRLREHRLGALGLFGHGSGILDDRDLELAQALAHVACVAIVNERSVADRDLVNSQLQHALTSRIVLEQAKGVIASTGDLDMEQAFAVLRRYARDHGRRLADIAAAVVARKLPEELLLVHARATAVLPT